MNTRPSQESRDVDAAAQRRFDFDRANMLTLDKAVEHYTRLGLDVSVRDGLLHIRIQHGVSVGELRLPPTQLDRRYIAHELAKLRRSVEQ